MAIVLKYALEGDNTVEVSPSGVEGRVQIDYEDQQISLLDSGVRELGELLIQIADDRGI